MRCQRVSGILVLIYLSLEYKGVQDTENPIILRDLLEGEHERKKLGEAPSQLLIDIHRATYSDT